MFEVKITFLVFYSRNNYRIRPLAFLFLFCAVFQRSNSRRRNPISLPSLEMIVYFKADIYFAQFVTTNCEGEFAKKVEVKINEVSTLSFDVVCTARLCMECRGK